MSVELAFDEEGLLPATRAYSTRVCDELADGERHVAERRQQREWKRRAREQ